MGMKAFRSFMNGDLNSKGLEDYNMIGQRKTVSISPKPFNTIWITIMHHLYHIYAQHD